jgi:molecular chaperone GrpE
MSSKNSEQNIQEEELKDGQSSDFSQEQEASTQAEENENQEQPEETAGEAEEPANEVEQLQEEVSKLKNQHLRLFADFENYKKRTSKERVELFGTANMELMSALLPVLDDFKRALKNTEGEEQEGVKLIANKFKGILKQKGLKPMEDTTGKEFDVDTMEAVTRIPAPDKKLKGKVVDEIEQGFYLGTKIIRYARVVVGE